MIRRYAIPMSAILLLLSCATAGPIERVKAYRAASDRGDEQLVRSFLAPGARMWFDEKKGEGEVLGPGKGRYAHWDDFFHSTATYSDWSVENGAVSATVHEINDFYRLLDWTPKPYRMTWWLDSQGRISEALLTSLPGETTSRMNEFRAWAERAKPEELAYVMPGGRIDPTADRPERFKTLLLEWRAAAGLPELP